MVNYSMAGHYRFPIASLSATTTISTSYFQSSPSSESFHSIPSLNQIQTSQPYLHLPSSNPPSSSRHSTPSPDSYSFEPSLPSSTPPSTRCQSPSAEYTDFPDSVASTRPLYIIQDQLRLFRDLPLMYAGGSQGPFIPQKMYRPHTQSDRRRYVEEAGLEEPILFWTDNPSELGIPLSDVLHSRVKRLRYRDETVFEGRGPSVSIRLEVSFST
jgi:hypothetical protein